MTRSPQVIVLAGPNGAGKSTIAPSLLSSSIEIAEFVNADVIAQGLSAFRRDSVAMEAGRIMLRRLDELAKQRADFAFETTLASRSFAPRITTLVQSGYRFRLMFLWLPSPDLAVLRVRQRVKEGGHDVPEETIRRRYRAGIRNFFSLYQPLADIWSVYNASTEPIEVIAEKGPSQGEKVIDDEAWKSMQAVRSHA